MKSEFRKIGFVSLGCPKNLVDSEVISGVLSAAGYERKTSGYQPTATASLDNILALLQNQERSFRENGFQIHMVR